MEWSVVAAAASLATFVLLVVQLIVGSLVLGRLLHMDKSLDQSLKWLAEFTAWLNERRKAEEKE